MSVTFSPQSYSPLTEKKWEVGPDGSVSAEIYTNEGIVEIFTYPGGEHGKPFTTFEIPCRKRKIDAEEARYLRSHGFNATEDGGQWFTTCPADGPMYRALGNSMAKPVLKWLGQRIELVDAIPGKDGER